MAENADDKPSPEPAPPPPSPRRRTVEVPQPPDEVRITRGFDPSVLLHALDEMSVIELNDLVKALEAKFGVSAAAVATSGTVSAPVASKEEKTEFDVVLLEVGANKVTVIKAIREITGLGLKEAKDLVEAAPRTVKEGLEKAEAEATIRKLTEAGARAEVK